jgi:hypothetical protein
VGEEGGSKGDRRHGVAEENSGDLIYLQLSRERHHTERTGHEKFVSDRIDQRPKR